MRHRNITIKIPIDLYKEIISVFKERGTTIETFVQLQLIAFSKQKAKSEIKLADRMPFGKYAGAQVEDIVRGDPSYIVYLIGQNANFNADVIELTKTITDGVV